MKAKHSDGDTAWVPLCTILSPLKCVREAKGEMWNYERERPNVVKRDGCGMPEAQWADEADWMRNGDGKDCMLSFCVGVMEKCVICQFPSLSPGWWQLWLCRTDTWQDALCPVFYSCYLAKINMFGWPGSLQTMSVVAVFDNWCSWTCSTADGLCHAIWGMSVPAVLWSLKWDHLISEWQSYPTGSPCLLGAGYMFYSKWLAITQPGLTEGTVGLLLFKYSSCTISSTRQNQEHALHSSLQDYFSFMVK